MATKTKFLTSENFRRLPEDIIFTGEIRETAKIPIRKAHGINFDGHESYWCSKATNYSKIPLVYANRNANGTEVWTKMQKFVTIERLEEKSNRGVMRFLRCYFCIWCYF